MRARDHRNVLVAPRDFTDRVAHPVERGQQDAFGEFLYDQRISEIADVLRSAREVHHLERQSEIQRVDLLLQKILERFDVVIGLGFERLDAARIGYREILVELAQTPGRLRVDRRKRVDSRIRRERQVPFDFNANAIADESVLAEIIGERAGARSIAAVNRADSDQGLVQLGAFSSADFTHWMGDSWLLQFVAKASHTP